MSNQIVSRGRQNYQWIPVTKTRKEPINDHQYEVALEWAQRTGPGERAGLQEVFNNIRTIGVALELVAKGVLRGHAGGGVTMPQVTREYLLGGGR